jgi:phage shock protein C
MDTIEQKTPKKLYRSKDNKIVSGLIAGFAEYIVADVTVLRLGFVLLTLLTGFFPMVLFYIIALFIVPEKI